MRSFHLFILFLLMSTVLNVQASERLKLDVQQSRDFFTVVLPYENSEKNEKVFELALQKAMPILLVRLTGQKSFLESRVAQMYLKTPKSWLKTYDVVPRIVDGVPVGKKIIFTFLEKKLRQEFHNRFVPIWPLSARPSTWVMGSMVQAGSLIKLDKGTMQYRLDAEFRYYPNKMKLPIKLPTSQNVKSWILPVESVQTGVTIQEVLAKQNQDYLLSFNVVMNTQQPDYLTWTLYNRAGDPVMKGEAEDRVFSKLTDNMFDQVMAYYVKKYRQIQKNNLDFPPVILSIHNVTQPEQVLFFENKIKSQSAMIRTVELVSMQAGQVQYRITPQVEYQKILNWIQNWSEAVLIENSQEKQTIELDAHFEKSLQSSKDR